MVGLSELFIRLCLCTSYVGFGSPYDYRFYSPLFINPTIFSVTVGIIFIYFLAYFFSIRFSLRLAQGRSQDLPK